MRLVEKTKDDNIGKSFICIKSIKHPNLGIMFERGEVVTISDYHPDNGCYSGGGPYITPESLKTNFKEYSGPIYSVVDNKGNVIINYANEEDAIDYAYGRAEWDESVASVKMGDKVIEDLQESSLSKEE